VCVYIYIEEREGAAAAEAGDAIRAQAVRGIYAYI